MPQINNKQVLWKEKGGVVTALMLDSGEFIEFNAVGSTIWRSLAQGEEVEAIIDALVMIYDASREQLALDTHAFIVKMRAANLLED